MARWLQRIGQHPLMQQRGAAFLVSGALIISTAVAANEALLTPPPNSSTTSELATKPIVVRNFSWKVTATMRGTLAYMNTTATEEQDGVGIVGDFDFTPKGKRYFDKQPVRSYHTDKTYTTDNNEYNGITLPFRISWLAVKRQQELSKIHKLVENITVAESELLQLANRMYDDFDDLHVADMDDYEFDNLDEQIEVRFDGKKFIDRDKVRNRINKRQNELQTKKIPYKQRWAWVEYDHNVLETATATYQAILAARQSPIYLQPPAKLRLNFDAHAYNDEDFRNLVYGLARLKQVRLLLARDILRLYEPFFITFYYSIGVREHLRVAVFLDDRMHKNEVTLRYEMRTTAVNHPKEFTLGRISFNRDLSFNKMWLSLKPRGNVPSFAKLTFTPIYTDR